MPETDPSRTPKAATRLQPPSRPISALAVLLVAGTVGAVAYLRTPGAEPAPGSQATTHDEPGWTLVVTADGQGLPDAKVTLVGEHCQKRADTDAQGVARFGSCPAGELRATTELAGYARDQRAIALNDDNGFEAHIELVPAARLTGTVSDEDDHPIASVTLIARALGMADPDNGEIEPWTTLSGPDGRFAFETLPQTNVALEARAGSELEPASVAEVALPRTDLAIRLRHTAAISGRVLRADGSRVGGALVTVAGSGVWPARNTASGSGGEFELGGLPEGIYELRAEADNEVSAPLEGVQLQAGKPLQLDVILGPGAVLRGHVEDAASGGGLLGAELDVIEEALSATPKRARSDGRGVFQVPGLRAIPHRVTVRAPGYVTEQRWVKPGTETSFELLRAGTIHGWVEDSNGRPVRRAELEVNGKAITGQAVHMVGPVQEAPALAPVQRPISADDSLGVTTGSVPRIPLRAASGANANQLAAVGFESEDDGSFHLEGLPPGQLVITARRATHGSGHSATLSLRPGAVLDDVVITLPRGKALTGRVIDAQGHGVPHVRVDLSIAGDATRSITTNNEGGFTFEAARGECTLLARPLGAPAIQLSGPADELTQREVTLRLPQTTDRLYGRVVDARGQPLDAVSVRVRVLSLPGFTPLALTESDGSFELNALPAPPYMLDVEHPDQLPIRDLSVTSSHGPVVIRMQTGTQLTGQVLDAQRDAPIADAEISFRGDGFRQVIRSQRDGSFELRHVPYGPYELTVSSEKYMAETQRGRLDAAPGRGLPLRITLTPGAAVSGDVVDALGSTVWNAQVTSGSPPAWDRATRTDHAGHFVLRGLAPGDHVLHARHGAVLAEAAATARVSAGETSSGAVIRLPAPVDDEAERSAAPPPSASSSTSFGGGGPLRFTSRGGAVVVEHVAPGTAAAKAGLTSGDVLLRVNGEPVRSAAQARGMLGMRGRLALDVRRGQDHYQLRYVR